MACTGPSLSLCPQLWAQCLVCVHKYFLPECQTHCLGMEKTKLQVRLSSAFKKGQGFQRWKGHTQQRKKHAFVVTEKDKTYSENSKSISVSRTKCSWSGEEKPCAQKETETKEQLLSLWKFD